MEGMVARWRMAFLRLLLSHNVTSGKDERRSRLFTGVILKAPLLDSKSVMLVP
ncbi:hypothetical protein AMATHDRAFT_11081 [Amanita thiersii Skay4041]|uniref:Uncharacterized protein n=1 Tax=Amanita thiersii Skay4041 TaxID=703135 RepID=A0A2A9N9A6_9AGAR|nr:hypothetical protein AMATHDRAFT_11081 [Amanita thiersii Skay4041]